MITKRKKANSIHSGISFIDLFLFLFVYFFFIQSLREFMKMRYNNISINGDAEFWNLWY